uniref:Phorbol-ester/DAG-type domain-containing protein n=1 Tax=Caenorhabditis japonica TaxID=281687 RepID=A0A8R1I1Y0_CAEJA
MISDKCYTTQNFDKPPLVSVQRAESARVPQLLISQPSFDLRRTQSESHLDAKLIDAVISSSADFGMENSVEDEIKMMLVGDLNRSASGNHMDPQLLGVVKREDKDKTLTQADAAKGLALIASQQTGSVASLVSTISNRTDTGTEDCAEDDPDAHLDRKRAASTRKAKIQGAFAAGKKKMLDLMPQKKKLSDTDFNGESIEIGADAGSLFESEMRDVSRSPMATTGKRKDSPSEDKKEKKRLKKKLSDSPKARRSATHKDQSPLTTIKSRTTKCVQFQKDIMWGQSLHFELDDSASSSSTRASIRYLNITVHAKEIRTSTPNTSASSLPSATPSTPESIASSTNTTTTTESSSSATASATSPEPKPILLGSVSLFVPQIVDDCRLTLSNCHREVFQLKQPSTSTPSQLNPEDPVLAEFSKHAGFDPRLCFGDITLGFRYFPNGFPSDKAINSGEESEDDFAKINHEQDGSSPTRPFSPPALSPACHDWKLWYGKNSTTCAMCRGKIWLRNASCCSRCLVICHNKCVVKANNGGIACSPQQFTPTRASSHPPLPLPDDSQFEEISASELDPASTPGEATHSETNSLILQSPSSSSVMSAMTDTPEMSRKARFKKVTEKFSNWRKGGKKKEEESGGTPARKDTLDTFDSELSSSTEQRAEDRDSPMASIQDVLADVLPGLDGSPFISGLYFQFQPGNAYNEQTIRNAKVLGREIYSDLPSDQRVEKINSQIDRIQTAIRETKDDRLSVMQNGGDISETSAKFQGLDERLQALAVLMLHYCSALQDCQSGRSTPSSVIMPENSEDVSQQQSPEYRRTRRRHADH